MVDSHTHLFIKETLHPDYKGFGETVVKDGMMKTDAARTLEAAYRAKTYLEEGFTSIVDLGNSGQYLDVTLRNAIDKKLVDGSRLFVSGPGIAALGGQINNYNPSLQKIEHKEYQIISNVAEGIKAVREHVLMKVNLIKLYADNIPNKTQLSIEELKALVDEAKNNGLHVTAHAITNDAAYKAAKGGVHSIEHAYQLADSTLTFIKNIGITVVPTYSDSELSGQMFKRYGMTKERIVKVVQRSQARQRKSLLNLYNAGVTIVFGSDFYSKTSFTRGKAAKHSLYSYLEVGIPLEQVLKFATYNAAVHLKQKDKMGVLKKNTVADIIAVKGNLQQDYKLLDDCLFIMKNGKIIKEN